MIDEPDGYRLLHNAVWAIGPRTMHVIEVPVGDQQHAADKRHFDIRSD